jgi:hypothetical protein
MELDGQVAIITGAGRGIGRATALELGRMGADVVVAELDPANAERTALIADVTPLALRGTAFGLDRLEYSQSHLGPSHDVGWLAAPTGRRGSGAILPEKTPEVVEARLGSFPRRRTGPGRAPETDRAPAQKNQATAASRIMKIAKAGV